MPAYIPHSLLIGIMAVSALLFLRMGLERREMLPLGISAVLASVWMLAVTIGDAAVQTGHVPLAWLAVAHATMAPAVFFAFVAVLLLEHHYYPGAPISRRIWIPPALAVVALAGAQTLDPQFFVRDAEAAPVGPGHFVLELVPGPGYYLFIALTGYVLYQVARRFPRIVQAMGLTEFERRTRVLYMLVVVTAFWCTAFELLPVLLGRAMPAGPGPSLPRVAGPMIGLAGALALIGLTGSLKPAVIAGAAFRFALRVALLSAIPAAVYLGWTEWVLGLSRPAFVLAIFAMTALLAVLSVYLKNLLAGPVDRDGMRNIVAVNHLVHELLLLRDLDGFTAVITAYLRDTVGAEDVTLLSVQGRQGEELYDPESRSVLAFPADVRTALRGCQRALTLRDVGEDPRLAEHRDALRAFFVHLRAEVLLPLSDEGRLNGILVLEARSSKSPYERNDVDFLDRVIDPLSLAFANTVNFELSKSGRPGKLFPAREFQAMLEQQWHRARRYEEALSVVLFRLEDAGAFEASHGEEAAAQAVRDVGSRLLTELRAFDVPALLDPHTIALLLPQTEKEGASVAGRRIRSWLEAQPVGDGETPVTLRFSLGTAGRDLRTQSSAADLLAEAEASLAAMAGAS